jgi:hypothetical protein
MNDNIIDLMKYRGKKKPPEKPEPGKINFLLLEKLAEQEAYVREYIYHLLEMVKASWPEKVERLEKENFLEVEDLGHGRHWLDRFARMGMETGSPQVREFINVFLNSPRTRQLIMNEYFFVIKPTDDRAAADDRQKVSPVNEG